jgi:hypothetical protein
MQEIETVTLNHEIGDDSMKLRSVVISSSGEFGEISAGLSPIL